jgi:hypothetical protein
LEKPIDVCAVGKSVNKVLGPGLQAKKEMIRNRMKKTSQFFLSIVAVYIISR